MAPKHELLFLNSASTVLLHLWHDEKQTVSR